MHTLKRFGVVGFGGNRAPFIGRNMFKFPVSGLLAVLLFEMSSKLHKKSKCIKQNLYNFNTGFM